VIKALVETCNIDQRLISAYHPRADGLVERFVQTSSQTIYKRMEARKDQWDKFVGETQLYMNNKVSAIHGSTPFALMFGRQLNGFQDYTQTISQLLNPSSIQKRLEYLTTLVYPTILKHMDDLQLHQKETYDKKNHLISMDKYHPGSQVMVLDKLRTQKSNPRYTGPFTVIRRNRGGSYILKGQDRSEYSFPPSVLKLVSQNCISPEQQSAVVDKVMHHREIGPDKYEYLVKWKDADESHNQWVSYENFDDITPVQIYWKARKEFVDERNSTRPIKKLRLNLRLPPLGNQ
jgi:hypothetical protein